MPIEGTAYQKFTLPVREFNSYIPIVYGTDTVFAQRVFMEGSISVGTISMGQVEIQDAGTGTVAARVLAGSTVNGTTNSIAVAMSYGSVVNKVNSVGTMDYLGTLSQVGTLDQINTLSNIGTISQIGTMDYLGTTKFIEDGTLSVCGTMHRLENLQAGTITMIHAGTISAIEAGTITHMPVTPVYITPASSATYGSINVCSSATLIADESASRRDLIIYNDTGVSLYVGTNNSVGTNNGFKRPNQAEWTINTSSAVWGILASGTGNAYYWQEV